MMARARCSYSLYLNLALVAIFFGFIRCKDDIVSKDEEAMSRSYKQKFSVAQLLARSFHHHISNHLDSRYSDKKQMSASMMMVTEESLAEQTETEIKNREKRAAIAREDLIWNHGIIPYEIDALVRGHKVLSIKKAMRHWENFTCIKFVERDPAIHPAYIILTELPCVCCSDIGKSGDGPHYLSIGEGCDDFGSVVHVLGHVIGFEHEHVRPDRDNHVQIIGDHIRSGEEQHFDKLTEEEINSFGLPYDYESIMHLSRNVFSKDRNLETIIPLDRRKNIGQRSRISEGDIAQAKLLYKCAKCGRTYQAPSGKFSNYLTHVNESVRCEWRITASKGEHIVLNITDMDMLISDQCSTDYLEIRDGYWHKSKLIGRYCGIGRLENLIVTASSRMLVTQVMSEKGTQTLRGFSAHYETVCGGDIFINDEIGHLESPNYPEDYPPNKECFWRITVPENHEVVLKFQSFETENYHNGFYDYIIISDGHGDESPLLGIYGSHELPPDIHSTGNTMSIRFVSDDTVQRAGFSAILMKEFDECAFIDHGCEQTCINTLGGYECACKIGYELHSDGKHCEKICGGRIYALNGTLISPSFPESYPGSVMSCTWEIIAPSQYKITLNFTDFYFQHQAFHQAGCESDRIEVYSMSGQKDIHKHGVYCSTRLPSTITSESNILRIELKSYYYIEKFRFASIFFADVDECAIDNGGCQHECQNTVESYICSCRNGFTLQDNKHDCKEDSGCMYVISEPRGNISSPNYPDFYPIRKNCVWVWHFKTNPGHRIELSFETFDLEADPSCLRDHVFFYDGDPGDLHPMGKYCGSEPPPPVISSTNQLYMGFISDSPIQRKGFLASYNTVCGGRFSATDTKKELHFQTRYEDVSYENGLTCEWIIEVKYGLSVRLTFLTLEIEYDRECSYSFVDVFADDSGTPSGKYCGNKVPATIISQPFTGALLIRFKTHSTITSQGFSASYEAVESS